MSDSSDKMPTDASVETLLELIRLERLEVNLFRGASRDIGTPRVFGGQVLAQSVHAASMTVEDRTIHSLHAYFLRAGDPEAPIVYNVDRSRDGRSFTARRVVAVQHGRPIFTMSASFQVPEEGLDHQFEMPEVPDAETVKPAVLEREALESMPQEQRRWYVRTGPFEFYTVRPIDPLHPVPRPPFNEIWFRLNRALDDDTQLMHRSLLAYASDFYLVGTATLPHGVSYQKDNMMMASLDHAMWFHRPVRVDDWLLYVCDSPTASGGRGLARGLIYDREGNLVASTVQEGVIRVRGGD